MCVFCSTCGTDERKRFRPLRSPAPPVRLLSAPLVAPLVLRFDSRHGLPLLLTGCMFQSPLSSRLGDGLEAGRGLEDDSGLADDCSTQASQPSVSPTVGAASMRR